MTEAAPSALAHRAEQLSYAIVDTHNGELRDCGEFVGDRASKLAFQTILVELRDRVSKAGGDPLGDGPSDEFSNQRSGACLRTAPALATRASQTARPDETGRRKWVSTDRCLDWLAQATHHFSQGSGKPTGSAAGTGSCDLSRPATVNHARRPPRECGSDHRPGISELLL